ncbi:MAG: hypothetical protein KAJ31_05855, partial [Deltaproteobacteria bacterium]|nr:hypothetical protein [Deltaproteobacteria bacterium]
MADFLGKLKSKIDKGLSTVNVKSKELIEKQKIKMQLSELEAEKKNVLLELGKLTYLMIEASEGANKIAIDEAPNSKKSVELKPDKWEQVVLSVLSSICDGKLDSILFENTDKDFKITAKVLSAEVQKSIPKSEQKGQNLQWLGRVLGKFGIASRKFSKRINRERETVYEFDKQKTLSTLNIVERSRINTSKKTQSTAYREQMIAKSSETTKLDTKITELE